MTSLVVTGTGTGVGKTVVTAALACHARQAGIDVAVCKPVQTGTDAGDDDLAEVARLSGVTELATLARYRQPLAPAAAAEHAGRALPTGDELVQLITGLDRPRRLTLVEGAGGLLVELADSGVTLRDLAADLGAAVLVVVTAELGTLNHTALTLEALAAQRDFVCRVGDRELARAARIGGDLEPVRAGPAGSGAGRAARGGGIDGRRRLRGAEQRGVRPRLGDDVGPLMVHSIELVFDADTEAAIRGIWEALAGAGIPSQAPASRPHVTLAVAEGIDADVDDLLGPVSRRLPLECAVGAPVLFGRANVVFARLVVPTSELLALHAEVHRLCLPHLAPKPMANSLPGQWTAHVTLARRVGGPQLGRALRIAGRPAQIDGRFARLRRWDGNKKTEYLL